MTAVQVVVPLAIRPHLFPPAHTTVALGSGFSGQQSVGPGGRFTFSPDHRDSQPGAWIVSGGAVNAAGQPVSVMPAACLSLNDPTQCMASHGIRIVVTYQPTSRYWALQWIESGIYLALALALTGYCFWHLGRRLS